MSGVVRQLARRGEWLIVALAALVRLWRLEYHSLWFDEAVSLQWATSSPLWTWQKTITLLEDKHPPGYYLLLHYWIELLDPLGLAGSDAGLRLLGSLLGVLTVVAVLLLVRPLSGRPVALLAGLLVALSPILVWYSQELRMFQPATTAQVWAGCCLLSAWASDQRWRRWGWWLGLVLTLLVALYSYLFSALVLPAAGLTLLLLWFTSSRAGTQWGGAQGARSFQRFLEGVIALAIVTVLFLPLAYNAWAINGSEGEPGQAFAQFGATLWRLLGVFTVWRVDWPEWLRTTSLALFALFTVAGLVAPVTNQPPRLSNPSAATGYYLDRAWLWLWLGVPLLVGNLLLASSDSVFAEDRYFLFLTPFVLWAVARGAIALGQRASWLRWGLGGAVAALLLAALPQLWAPAMYRENWRAAADYIIAYQRGSPGLSGAVVAHPDYTRRPLEHYLRPALAEGELPLYFPFGGALAEEQVDTVIAPPLQGIVEAGVATLWLTQSHLEGMDDQRLVESWLNQRFPLVTEQFPSGVKLSGFALQSKFSTLPTLAEKALYPAAELAPGLQLAACEVLTTALPAQDEQMHPPSGWVHVRLWWQATSTLTDNYIARVQLVGPEGVWGDRLYRDNEALRRWPTSTWTPGELVRDEVDVNLNPDTLPGEYPIIVGLLDGAGQPLADTVECGRVRVTN